MEIRRIQPEEKILASKIQTIAFTTVRDFSTYESSTEEFQKGCETGRAVFDDTGKMCSCMNVIPYEYRFNGQTVKMAGIGGVASLPEERGKGYIRKLFRFCFEEMAENGQWFSYLFPFSNPYYRKFGYELCLRKFRSVIPVSAFGHFPSKGQVRLLQPGMDIGPVKEIYDRFIENKDLAIVRNDALWEKRIVHDPYQTGIFTYLWQDASGQTRSYITYQARRKERNRADLQVNELVWLDGESLLGLLGFVYQLVSRYDNFIWDTPEFLNLHLLFPEPQDIKTEVSGSGMNRIVNLEKALGLVAAPAGEGRLVFEVADDFLEWNNGTFVVSWNSGGVEVEKKAGTADLSCSIQVLTQLLTGFITLEDLFWRKDVRVYGSARGLTDFFGKKYLYMNDHF